jgi:hypothetical protein
MLQHFWGNNSLKIKVHRSRLYCTHFTAVLTSKFPLYFRGNGKGIFREKNTIPANTGIDIFEIPVLYRPRYCIFNTELETLGLAMSPTHKKNRRLRTKNDLSGRKTSLESQGRTSMLT